VLQAVVAADATACLLKSNKPNQRMRKPPRPPISVVTERAQCRSSAGGGLARS
jgi:hypothetical protein